MSLVGLAWLGLALRVVMALSESAPFFPANQSVVLRKDSGEDGYYRNEDDSDNREG